MIDLPTTHCVHFPASRLKWIGLGRFTVCMSLRFNRMALLESLQGTFQHRLQSHPDADLDGAESTIDAAPVFEFTTMEAAVPCSVESAPNAAKKRVVILSQGVKRSDGKPTYNVHKGRQNSDRKVQIGRSWELDRLTSVDCHPSNPNLLVVGFGKPYFWMFADEKSRDSFAEQLKSNFSQHTNKEAPSILAPPVPQVSRQRSQRMSQQRQAGPQPAPQGGPQGGPQAGPQMGPQMGPQQYPQPVPQAYPQYPQYPQPYPQQYPQPVPMAPMPQMYPQQYPQPFVPAAPVPVPPPHSVQVPQSQVPQSQVPQNTVPGALVPPALAPDAPTTVPSVPPPVPQPAPQADASQAAGTPQSVTPQGTTPQNATPQGTTPRSTSQDTPMGTPQTSRSRETAASSNEPLASVPQIPKRSATRSVRSTSVTPAQPSPQPQNDEDDDELNFSNVQEKIETSPQRTLPSQSDDDAPLVPPRVDQHLHVDRMRSIERHRSLKGASSLGSPTAGGSPSPTAGPASPVDKTSNQHQPPGVFREPSNRLGSAFQPVPQLVRDDSMPALDSNLSSREQSPAVSSGAGMLGRSNSGAHHPHGFASPQTFTSPNGPPTALSDLNSVIDDLNWDGDSLATLECEIKQRLEVLSNQNFASVINLDDELGGFGKMVRTTIRECDSVDAKLQAVAMNLAGRRGEVSDIENREDGLQVSSLNYRKLAAEIEKLLEVSSLDDQFVTELQGVQFSDHASPTHLHHIEGLLLDLNQALEMFSHRVGRDVHQATMQALQEPKRMAEEVAARFSLKLYEFLSHQFENALKSVPAFNATQPITSKMVFNSLEAALFDSFYIYSGCILFVRDTTPKVFHRLLSVYEKHIAKAYDREFPKAFTKWRENIQQLVARERMLSVPLKIPEYKEDLGAESAGGTDGSVGVMRNSVADKRPKITLSVPLLQQVYAQMQLSVNEICLHVASQQVFIERFFHLGSNESLRYNVFVTQEPLPTAREKMEERSLREIEFMLFGDSNASTNSGPLVQNIMQNHVMPNLYEQVSKTWTSTLDSMQLESVYLIVLLDIRSRELMRTNQQFLASILYKLYCERVAKWEDDSRKHSRNILSVRFKTKKRVGVHPVVRWFTEVLQSVEYSVSAAQEHEHARLRQRKAAASELSGSADISDENYDGEDARQFVDKCHENMFRAIAQGLRMGAASTELQSNQGTAARLKAAATAGGNSSMEETKELLNRHVVMIENLYCIFTDLGKFGSVGIQKIVIDAKRYYKQELSSYVTDVVSRPLGKIMLFLHQYETQMPGAKPKECASALKRAVKGVDRKEIKVGVEQLRKRVEKHFTGSDRAVLNSVWKAIGAEYANIYTKLYRIAQSVEAIQYIDFQQSDFTSAF